MHLCYLHSTSQNIIDNSGWVKVNNLNFLPGSQQESFTANSLLNSLLGEHQVYYYELAVPFANTNELKQYVEVKCNCDLDSLNIDLENNFQGDFEKIYKDSYGDTLMLYDPTDWMWWAQKNDSTIDWLWFLERVESDKAWDITIGDSSIKVAVMDGNVDITHPDLSSEIILPYDPYTLQPHGCILGAFPSAVHGTSVASLVSAQTTEQGIQSSTDLSSIGFNTKMYFYNAPSSVNNGLQKALHSSSVMKSKVFVTCIGFALDCNYQQPVQFNNPSNRNPAEKLIIKEMLDNGTSIVIGAGNGTKGLHCRDAASPPFNFYGFYPYSPVYDERIIVVSSTGKDDKHYFFANGSNRTHSHFSDVDVCAPGYDLMVATSTTCDTTGSVWPYFGFGAGTSFSSPFVAGLMSLIYSINPCLSTADAEAILKSTTDPILDADSFPGLVGTGRINAYKAVMKAQQAKTAAIDLYIKDRKEDFGLSGGYDWQLARDNSPDIWVRNQNDGLVNKTHQSPEYQSNSSVYVYVKVRNKSCDTSSSQELLKLFWTKAASWSSWPQNWDGTQPLIGNIIDSIVIPPLLPGNDTILEFTWNILNPHIYQNWSTCLLARIEGNPLDSIKLYPGRIDDDVYFNNNVAMKNITIIDSIAGIIPPQINGSLYPVGNFIFVGNSQRETQNVNLRFVASLDDSKSASIIEEGEVKVITNQLAWSILENHINSNPHIEVKDEPEYSFVIKSKDVTIENLEFPPNSRVPFYIGFSFLTDEIESHYFTYDVHQSLAETNQYLGGQHFIITRKERALFYADAGPDLKVKMGDFITLEASEISENATYNWYDSNGEFIGEGLKATINPEFSQDYTLEVLSEVDGYKDEDRVYVEVLFNWIEQLSPNPTNTNIDINCVVEEGATASIMIMNATATISNTFYLLQDHISIDVSTYLPGNYTAILLVNGVAVDSEVVIIN